MKNRSRHLTARYLSGLLGRCVLKPSFYLIGAQKSGTTSLFSHLIRHPCILEPLGKEIHYFYENYCRDRHWYESWFPSTSQKPPDSNGNCITGDGSTGYLFEPHTPARIRAYTPDAKFIAILRNPIERAYSAYQHEVRKRGETRTFDEVVRDELGWMEKEYRNVLDHPLTFNRRFHFQSHLRRGYYAEQLKRWFELFPRDQFLILCGDEFFSDPGSIYERTIEFLSLPEYPLNGFKPHNVGGYCSKLSDETRQFLEEHYAPLNQELYDLLGIDYGW